MFRSRTTIEIGFNATPGDLDPGWINTGFTWTDVSAYATKGYNTFRGCAEFEGLKPGDGLIELDNDTTGRFDPSNAGSPYAGQMTSGKPIRIRETINLIPRTTSTGDDVATLTAIGGAALAVSNTVALSASNSIRVQNAAGTIGFTTPTGTSGYPVFGGEPITCAVWMRRTSATGRNCTVSARFFDAAGATITTVTGAVVASTAAFQQVYVQTVAPANAAFVALRVEFAAAVVGDVHYVDNLAVVPAADAQALTWYPGGPIDVFRGAIDSWLPRQQHPQQSITTVAFSGSFGIIADAPYGASLWETLVARSAPALWWRFGEQDQGQRVADSSGNGWYGTYKGDLSGTPITFTEGLAVEDGNGAVNFDSTWRQYVDGPGFVWPSTTYQVAFLFRLAPGAAACTFLDSSRLTITISAAGLVTADALGVSASTSAGIDYRDGQAHLVLVTVSPGSTSIAVDLSGGGAAAGVNTAERLNQRLYIARNQAGTAAQYCTGVIDEVVIWNGNDIPSIDWWYLAAMACKIRPLDQGAPPSPADVANFVIDMMGASVATGSTASSSYDGPWVTERVPMAAPLDLLNQARTQGQLDIYERADGTPAVDPVRYVPGNQETHLAALTVGFGAGEHGYLGDPVIDFGEASVINEVKVQLPTGSTVTYKNATSKSTRNVKSTTIPVWTTIERCYRDLAAWLLSQYANEGRRMTEIQPDVLQVNTAQAMLLVDIGDIITVKDATVDGRTVTTTARVVGKRVAKVPNVDDVPQLKVWLTLSPVRIQPIVLDSSSYGVLGAHASVGKWGP